MNMAEITYKKILVPTDGSDYSYNAGEHAVYLAKMAGSRLYILYVVDTDMAFHSGIHYAEDVCELEKSGPVATGKIKAMCEKAGVPCEEMIVRGKPADTILSVANNIGADLIAIGSIGMSAIERVLIGSVSDRVARHAKCPVLIVHPKK